MTTPTERRRYSRPRPSKPNVLLKNWPFIIAIFSSLLWNAWSLSNWSYDRTSREADLTARVLKLEQTTVTSKELDLRLLNIETKLTSIDSKVTLGLQAREHQ